MAINHHLPKILFLDRDAPYVEEVKHRLEQRFDIYSAQDTIMAVRMIKRLRPQAVVSEINMSEINSIAIIIKLREHIPEVVTLIITGEKDPDIIASAQKKLGNVNFLKKPISIADMAKVLRAAVLESYRRAKTEEKPEQEDLPADSEHSHPSGCFKDAEEEEITLKLVKQIEIPSQPKLVLDIYREIKKAETSFAVIGQLVAQDAGMAARIIRVVNSPYYGRGIPIKSIQQAMTTLGINNFYKVVLTSTLREVMAKGIDAKEFERIWDHMLNVARVAEFIAIWTRSAASPEHAYLTGLFHDCAIAFLQSKKAGYRDIIFGELKCSNQTILATEDDFLGSNHAVMAWWMAKDWGLPTPVCAAIRHHHSRSPPGSMEIAEVELWFLLRLAEYLLDTILLSRGRDPFEYLAGEGPDVVGFEETLLQRFGLSANTINDLQNDIVSVIEL